MRHGMTRDANLVLRFTLRKFTGFSPKAPHAISRTLVAFRTLARSDRPKSPKGGLGYVKEQPSP